MPTNVPPQYRDAEQRFREAASAQGKIAALQEMLQIMPKHKGTDHLKAQLRSRLSKLMSDPIWLGLIDRLQSKSFKCICVNRFL